jgi:hypothetical protein
MTFEEIDQKYPNGFVDAEIGSINIDYESRTAILRLNLRRNPPDSPNNQEYEPATLIVHGFYYCSIEAPSLAHISHVEKSGITVDGFPEDPSLFPPFEQLKTAFPAGAFCCRFFVHDWNSFIHIGAQKAEFVWAASDSSR